MNTESLQPQELELIKSWVLDHLPYEVMWMDEHGVIVYANAMCRERLGYTAADMQGLTIWDVNTSSTKASWREHWLSMQEEGGAYFHEMHRAKDGQYYDVEVFTYFFSNDRKNLICAIINDIEESNFYQRLSRDTEYMADVGGWQLNMQDGSLLVTSGAKRIFHVEDKEALQPVALRQHFADPELFQQQMTDVMRGGSTMDHVFALRDGERMLRLIMRPMKGDDRVIGIAGSFQEVTTYHHQQRDLECALEEISALKDQLEEENAYYREASTEKGRFDNIICQSPAYARVLKQVEQVAPTDTTVLITGESGTGKELLATALHRNSRRQDQPMIIVNCAALPKELFESELFGHKKGAFTGAVSDKVGKFALADGGTIFLDEIGELPLGLQPKLLRVLQEGAFDPVGGHHTLTVDVRIVAATNRDLHAMVAEGTFREDLFYRLNVFPIHNLALRDRTEDIPLLAEFFLQKYAAKIGKPFRRLAKPTIDRLMAYDFPGNVRELEHLIERAIIIEEGPVLKPGDWLPRPSRKRVNASGFETFEQLQRRHIIDVLNHTGWRVSGPKGAAAILDMNAKTLWARMKRLGIEKKVVLQE